MSYRFSFSRYQTKCVIKFLFTQLLTSKTLRFIFDHSLADGWQGKNEGKRQNYKIENKKSFLDKIKMISHNYLRAVLW